MSFVFLQILEYYHEAFVLILKGLALFFFCLPNLHLLLVLKEIQKKIAIQLWGGWDKVKLLLQHEIACNIKKKDYAYSNSQKKNVSDPHHFYSVLKDLMGSLTNECHKKLIMITDSCGQLQNATICHLAGAKNKMQL